MYSFQSSSGVAKQAIEVILILLRPVFQEREKGAYFVSKIAFTCPAILI